MNKIPISNLAITFGVNNKFYDALEGLASKNYGKGTLFSDTKYKNDFGLKPL